MKRLFFLFVLLCFSLHTVAQELAPVVKDLRELYANRPDFRENVDSMLATVHHLPGDIPNPWSGKSPDDLWSFLNEWFYFIPDTRNGLDRILQFSFLYYKNDFGKKFILEEPGRSWSLRFIEERGLYMDSPESVKGIAAWLRDPSINHSDFETPDDGYRSFNHFFTRNLRPGVRPVTDPEDESVMVSPADGIVNMIANQLTPTTQIPTKGGMTMSLRALLGDSPYASKFIGGAALAVFLMPDNYHHYHAPVSGQLVESRDDLGDRLFGMPDILDMMNRGNPAYNKDYSVFQHFRHGYFIFETNAHGYVAMIPIGLQTIGSVVFEDDVRNVQPGSPVSVVKGQQLGHFAYGGSTVLLLIEPGRMNAMSVEQGQRIGKLRPAR